MDGLNYTTIFVVGEEIHEGWNYYSYGPGQELKYRYYRFFSLQVGSCGVGEVSLRGIEAINDNNSSYTCLAKIYL